MQYSNKDVCSAKNFQTVSFQKINLSLFYLLILVHLLVLCQTANAGSYEVSPMMFEFESEPKINEKFQFHIKGLTAGKVRIYTAGLKQQLTGHMGFIDERMLFSDGLAGWLSLDKTHFEVKKDQVITVNGQFKVPVDASGGYLAAIMVEEDRKTDVKGVVLNVRYAIILNLKVTGKRRYTRILGEFNKIEVFELNGQQVLQGQFNSLAANDYFLESVAYLRNADKKLVAKINLKSQSAWQRNDPASRIFPGAKVKVNAPFRQVLSAGIYDVVVKNRFGKRLQKTFKTKIKIDGPLANKSLKPSDVFSQITAQLKMPIQLKVNRKGIGRARVVLKNSSEFDLTIVFDDSVQNHQSNSVSFIPRILKIPANSKRLFMLKQKISNPEGKGEIKTYKITLSSQHKKKVIQLTTKG